MKPISQYENGIQERSGQITKPLNINEWLMNHTRRIAPYIPNYIYRQHQRVVNGYHLLGAI